MSLSLRITSGLTRLVGASFGMLTSPFITVPALAILAWRPESLAQYLPDDSASGVWQKVLAASALLGSIRIVNKMLNGMATSNWRLSPAPDWQWQHEVAVITGGCGGIGQEMARGLAEKGVRVAVLDVQVLPEALQGVERISHYHCDLTSFQSIHDVAESVKKDLGHPSLLINNAGLTNQIEPTSKSGILHVTEKQLRRLFDVNCLSHWATTREFLPTMIARNKGHVVTIASMASFVTCPMNVDYSASKIAALSFHEGLTCELKHIYKAPGILTTVVHPSFVQTPMTAGMTEHNESRTGKQLSRDLVANRVLEQVYRRKGGQIILPEAQTILAGVRGWPNWLQEVLRDALGRDAAAPLGIV